jgi:hypothetical protein
MKNHIPLSHIQRGVAKTIIKSQGKIYSNIELCRIEEVDTTNKVVSAYFIDSGKLFKGIPYCYQSYGGGCGIITVPTRGALGVAAWDSHNKPIILCFTAPSTITPDGTITRDIPKLGSLNLPDLLEGEILILGPERSFIKFDKLGGLFLSSSLFGYIRLAENGDYELDIENGQVNVNGVLEEIYTDNYKPVLKIVKGKHNYKPTQLLQGSVELCYRISILDQGSTDNNGGSEDSVRDKGFIGVGTDGNIYYSGKLIKWGE